MSNKVQDFVEKNKNTLLAVAGVSAVGALVWTLLSRKTKEDIKDKAKEAKKDVESLITPLTTPRSEADIKVGWINLDNNQKILDRDSLIGIHSLIAKRMTSRYIRKAVETRKERRKHMDDIHKYIDDCNVLHQAYAQLIHQITARILIELKLDPESYQAAFDYHARKDPNQDWLDSAALADPDIVPSAKKLTKQKVVEMYEYQLEIIEDVVHDLSLGLGKKSAESASLDYLIDFRLVDLTAINLQIEEEDLLNKYNAHFKSDPEVKILEERLQRKKGSMITRFA